jgi:hypothetical protein
MRFEVLRETSMKMTVFWDIAPCGLVDISLRSLHPYDGGSKLLWNVGQYLSDYTVQYHRRQPYSKNIRSQIKLSQLLTK